MKATWRAKAQAYKAKEAGYEDIDIHRNNRVYYVYLCDIINTPLGARVEETEYPEHLLCNLDAAYFENRLSFRDLMSL